MCDHENMKEECFINRADIKFQKCQDCGEKKYPAGFVKVFGGTHTEIVWPL